MLNDNVKCTSNTQTDHNMEVKAKVTPPNRHFCNALQIPTGPADQARGVDRDALRAHGRTTDAAPVSKPPGHKPAAKTRAQTAPTHGIPGENHYWTLQALASMQELPRATKIYKGYGHLRHIPLHLHISHYKNLYLSK